jgi:hypothetical protein
LPGISFLAPRTAAIVRSIPVRVNVKQFATPTRTFLLRMVVVTSQLHQQYFLWVIVGEIA